MKSFRQYLHQTLNENDLPTTEGSSPKPTLFLIRGMPGSGKSTLAKSLVQPDNHFENDQFWMTPDGKYNFDSARRAEAHADTLARTSERLTNTKSDVAVSNTFTQVRELQPYLDLAKHHGWNTQIIRMTGNHGSIHDVPPDTIDQMKKRFEDIESERII